MAVGFMTLPPEIRTIIYELLLIDPSSPLLPQNRDTRRPLKAELEAQGNFVFNRLAIFRTCKMIKSEAFSIFFSQNIWALDLEDQSPKTFSFVRRTVPLEQLRLMTDLKVNVRNSPIDHKQYKTLVSYLVRNQHRLKSLTLIANISTSFQVPILSATRKLFELRLVDDIYVGARMPRKGYTGGYVLENLRMWQDTFTMTRIPGTYSRPKGETYRLELRNSDSENKAT